MSLGLDRGIGSLRSGLGDRRPNETIVTDSLFAFDYETTFFVF